MDDVGAGEKQAVEDAFEEWQATRRGKLATSGIGEFNGQLHSHSCPLRLFHHIDNDAVCGFKLRPDAKDLIELGRE
jgi:hypothetical protein